MKKQTFTISNISCSHCVSTIEKELHGLAGVTNINGSPQTKAVIVEWRPPTTASEIEAKLAEIGYPAST